LNFLKLQPKSHCFCKHFSVPHFNWP
jgi:hypothetical protein